ncbi:hypothetical protein MTO96_037802 [Rhipicephalus appendiculatus]
MAYAGARGSSEAELGLVLGHTTVGLTDRSRVLAAYKTLLQLAASPNVTLDVANLVLAQSDFPITDSYRQQLRNIFDAELRSADFADAGQSLDIVLFILNAVYFKGTWVTKFDAADTADKPFFNLGTSEAVRDGLSVAVIEALSNNMDWENVVLRLPKFEMGQRYNLEPTMRALGLHVVFGRSADFSRIVDGERVRISGAVHEAAIEVNEEGTVAAAVTGLSIGPIPAANIPPPPILFIVDHPFLYYIGDKDSNRILFLGEVNSL